MDDINEVTESIIDAAVKWKFIGDGLEVGSGELDRIEKIVMTVKRNSGRLF